YYPPNNLGPSSYPWLASGVDPHPGSTPILAHPLILGWRAESSHILVQIPNYPLQTSSFYLFTLRCPLFSDNLLNYNNLIIRVILINQNTMEPRNRKSYDTLSEAVNDLQSMGYVEDFVIQEEGECLFCVGRSMELSPEQFVIDEIYRFEGMTDPGDESILFAISSTDNLIKGLVINSFGAD